MYKFELYSFYRESVAFYNTTFHGITKESCTHFLYRKCSSICKLKLDSSFIIGIQTQKERSSFIIECVLLYTVHTENNMSCFHFKSIITD